MGFNSGFKELISFSLLINIKKDPYIFPTLILTRDYVRRIQIVLPVPQSSSRSLIVFRSSAAAL